MHEIALKGGSQVALQLNLFMQLSMHKNVRYDSVKGEIGIALYAALEDASKILFQEHLHLHKKLMVSLSEQLRVHLRLH